MSTSTACNPDLLRRSLDDRLSEAEEESLTSHLTDCKLCRSTLEELAGGQLDWSKVQSALSSDSSLVLPTGSWSPTDGFIDEVGVDFAVDFLDPCDAPEAIGRLGDIEILGIIGQGGMGVVLKGHQPELKRLVGVKVLAPPLATSGAARRRFAREAQAAAAIVHPNVMPILSVNSLGKLPFLVMPFLQCESLQDRLDRDGSLELVDILRIGMQTANGLSAAHAQGIVHRDVKPGNILLEMGVDRVLLTDFGLARAIDDASITRTGVIAGTPMFMSPEQARGEPIDARSDLFSLGSVLYTMATGRPPFRAESTYGILRRITDTPHRPIGELNPQLPTWLAALIDKLLAKEPTDRFATSAHVAGLLERCLAHVQQPAVVELPTEVVQLVEVAAPKPTLVRRLLPWSVLGVGVLVSLLLTIVLPTLLAPTPTSEPEVSAQGSADKSPSLTLQARPETKPRPETLDWDAPATNVQRLRSELQNIEQESRQIWKEVSPD